MVEQSVEYLERGSADKRAASRGARTVDLRALQTAGNWTECLVDTKEPWMAVRLAEQSAQKMAADSDASSVAQTEIHWAVSMAAPTATTKAVSLAASWAAARDGSKAV